MRITKWGEYGILCCLYLARHGSEHSVGALELSRERHIPLQYTQQILQRLRRGGVIESLRGPGGGYKLSRDPSLINLKEILYAAEGTTFEIICNTKNIPCHKYGSKCVLHPVWQELKQKIDETLENHTLASLLGKNAELCACEILELETPYPKDPAQSSV